jgi:excisionase family DNA binding protein
MRDIEAVAQQLNRSERTIRGLVRSGKLRAYRIGGKRGWLRFKEEDLATYSDSTLVRPEAVAPSPSQHAYQDMNEHAPDLGDT